MPVRLGCSPAPELMVTIRPNPARFIPGATACASRKCACRLMSTTSCQSLSGTSSSGRMTWPRTPPALDASTPTGASACFSTSAIQAFAAPGAVRSKAAVWMAPGWSAVSSSSAAERSQANTCAPSAAKDCAMARPKPWPAPVTATTAPPKSKSVMAATP